MVKKPANDLHIKPSSRPQIVVHKKSKKLQVISVAAFGFIILAILIAGIYYYIQTKPEKVISDALTNAISDTVNTVPQKSNTFLALKISGDQPVGATVSLAAQSAVNEGKYDLVINLNVNGKTQPIKISIIVVNKNELYFKVHDFKASADALAATSAEAATYMKKIEPLITKIDGKWIRIDKDDIKGLDTVEIQKCADAISGLEVTKDNEKQLKQFFKNSAPVKSAEVLDSEEVAGQKSFHYRLELDPLATVRFFNDVQKLQAIQPLKGSCGVLASPQNKQLLQQIKQALLNDPNLMPHVELWVGKKTRRITKVRITINNKETDITFSTEQVPYTENIEVNPPEGSIPFADISNEITAITGN